MDPPVLRDGVERWLVHESYRFSYLKTVENHFTIRIKQSDSFAGQMEVFCPIQQTTALVIGIQIPLKNTQNARYRKLNRAQKKVFVEKIEGYCRSIRAISRMSKNNGVLTVGIYAVLDDKERFNQHDFSNTLNRVAEMGDQVARFLIKTF